MQEAGSFVQMVAMLALLHADSCYVACRFLLCCMQILAMLRAAVLGMPFYVVRFVLYSVICSVIVCCVLYSGWEMCFLHDVCCVLCAVCCDLTCAVCCTADGRCASCMTCAVCCVL
jgi:hypothetical protein